MSRDMHAHVEVKIRDKWRYYGRWNFHPTYLKTLTMKMMCGELMKGDETGFDDKPIVPILKEARGLPKGLTYMTRYDHRRWADDAHHESWMTGAEVDRLVKWYDSQMAVRESGTGTWVNFEHHVIGYVFGNGWDVKRWVDEAEREGQDNSYGPGVQDVRVIFWFDC
jgi:hypothetical protein